MAKPDLDVLSVVDDYIAQHGATPTSPEEEASRDKVESKDDGLPTVPKNAKVSTFSKVFGLKPADRDHEVLVFKRDGWDESVRPFIPDVDPTYVPELSALEDFAVAMRFGDKTLIHGPKGSGKTSLARYFAAKTCTPLIRVNCREDMDSSAIFGMPTVQDGNLGYQYGPAPLLALHGGILLVDEISAAPAGINMAMQAMLESPGQVYLADHPGGMEERVIPPSDLFRVVATDNTELQGDASGHYVGTQVQNEAMIDRFGATIHLDYMAMDDEVKMLLGHVPGIGKDHASKMVSFARAVRDAYGQGTLQFAMSPRGLINWARKAVYWGSYSRAFRSAFHAKLTEVDRKVTAELFFKIFGVNI